MTTSSSHAELCLVTAKQLEELGVMPKSTAYRMAAEGKLPYYSIGCRGRGIRFKIDEVLAALRQPACPPKAVPQ